MKRSLLILAALALAGMSANAAESSCVRCHTSDATMKSIFVPPVLPEAEGEG